MIGPGNRRPTDGDHSRTAKAARRHAVASVACPKCSSLAGDACKAKGGGTYDPAYTVHAARLDLAVQEASV